MVESSIVHQGLQVMGQELPINCSVYALTSGTIQFRDFNNNSWYGNLSSFLPAYYITNCSVQMLKDYFAPLDIDSTAQLVAESVSSPFNQSGNGDTFVALLFTVSGTCVSSWMLSLLLYVSPKHKRKPKLAQVATIAYSVVVTILMTKLTQISSQQYYADELNLVDIQTAIFYDNAVRITSTISQFCTLLAWLQIIMHMSKMKWRWYVFATGSVFIIILTVLDIIYEVVYDNQQTFLTRSRGVISESWKMAMVSLMLVFVSGFAVSLLYYTTMDKNPRKICYSKRLLPLALFNWLIIGLHIILNILILTLYRDDWQTRIWLSLLPDYIDIVMLTTVWEWIYNISVLEKRYELMGVLGRRISFDDAASFDSTKKRAKTYTIYEGGANIFYHLKSLFSGKHVVTKDEINPEDSQTQTQVPSSSNYSKELTENSMASSGTAIRQNSLLVNQPEQENIINHPIPSLPSQPIDTSPNSVHSYDEEYVDYDWNDDNDLDDVDENENENDLNPSHGPTSHNRENLANFHANSPDLPAFRPHPGFSQEDYWNDRKN